MSNLNANICICEHIGRDDVGSQVSLIRRWHRELDDNRFDLFSPF